MLFQPGVKTHVDEAGLLLNIVGEEPDVVVCWRGTRDEEGQAGKRRAGAPEIVLGLVPTRME